MKNIGKCTLLFTIGGIGYAGVEILWRQKTHFSMVIAGGVCFVMLDAIRRKMRGSSLVLQACVGALAITLVELAFGILFNIIFDMNVWNYSSMPFNFLGQICPLYTALWFLLSLFIIPFAAYLRELLFGEAENCRKEPKKSKVQ